MLKRTIKTFVLVLLAEVVIVAGIVLVSQDMAMREYPPLVGAAAPVVGFALLAAPIVLAVVLPGIAPRWTTRVLREGRQAPAIVLANDVLKGIGGYEGENVWVELPARVQPEGEPPFEASVKCRLSQSLALSAGTQVAVKYDARDRRKVVLLGDLPALFKARVNT